MIAAVCLVGYAVVVGWMVPRVLLRATWTGRAPRLAIAAWQALTGSMLGALILAGLMLAVPASSFADGVAGLLRSCETAVRQPYTDAGGLASAGGGLVLAGVVLLRSAWSLTFSVAGASRLRRRHRAQLRLIGRPSERLGATILDTRAAAAYCLPGRSAHVVVTTGALAALSPRQVGAVLAHERAHLAGHHHLVIGAAQGLARAFPNIPLLRIAVLEVTRLVEMLADDVAARRSDRTLVATALVMLAEATTPEAALAAGGPTALARVSRLLAPANPLGRVRTAGGFGLVAMTLLAPVVIAAAPAVAAIAMSWCSPTAATPTAADLIGVSA